ncbi:MAG: PD-(D/E)XK nuclease family protein [Candidatus Aminicenantes bacterium]|nr:PD-(D/E)XK nuclease family protein [Candidatus Aminicenantes bacterium]
MNTTLSFMADYLKAHVLDEKIFVVPSYVIGHQIGESLVARGHSWINLRFMTLPSLGQDAAGFELSKRKLKKVTGTASLFLVEHIFRRLKEEGTLRYFKELEISSGLTRALQRSIAALRLAGLESKNLESGQFINENKGKEIILLLKEYEKELETRLLLDQAGIYNLALEAIGTAKPVLDKVYLCLENHIFYGLERDFLERIAGERLTLVPQGPVFGLERPRRHLSEKKGQTIFSSIPGKNHLSSFSGLGRMAWLFAPEEAPEEPLEKNTAMFCAVGPTNECREILRRILLGKIPFDQVEVIHPPGVTYPSVFFVLSAKAGIKVTYAEGVPAGFTAPGTAFRGLVEWAEHDYQAADLCRMIEGGTLRLSRKKNETIPSPRKISSYLKNAMIGWGRERYLSRLGSLRQSIRKRTELDDDKDLEETDETQIETAIREVKWLESLVRQFLYLMPIEDDAGLLDMGLLCQGVSIFIRKYAYVRNDLDREALSALSARLNEASLAADTKVSNHEAFEWLRSLVDGLSVGASGPLPGHIHLAGYGNGGYSGRRMFFVAGLDQGAFPGASYQDPILLDEEREALSDALPTTADAFKEKLFTMASTLASLRGKAVFSFSSFDIIEERPSFPSSLLLQVFRLVEGDPALDYSALAAALPEAAGFLPLESAMAFDEIDWWLSRLAFRGRLRDGKESIRRNFPDLNRGIEAIESRAANHLTWFDGLVAVDERELNPMLNQDIVMSASRFETLARCPFGYFLRYVLGIKKPDELEYDQSRWLDARQRGSLLHQIFSTFMRSIRGEGQAVSLEKHLFLIEKIADDHIVKIKEEIPPPSEGIYAGEKRELMEAIRVFLKSEENRDTQVDPILFEVSFGMKEESGERMDEPAVIRVDRSRSVRLRGKIDRIDRLRAHQYRVIDYKTGGYGAYDGLNCFARGKNLQHALYSLAAEQILERLGLEQSAEVIQSGYYFPTRKGEGKEILVDRVDRQKLRELLLVLTDILAAGNFIVNPDAKCEYCDFLPVCPVDAPAKAKAQRAENPAGFSVFERLKDYE